MALSRRSTLSGAALGVLLLAGAGLATALPAAADPPAPVAATGQPVQSIIVGYKPGSAKARDLASAAKDATAKAHGRALTAQRRLSTGGVVVGLGSKDARDAAQVIAEYKADPDVDYVEADQMMHPLADPTDTDYGQQWDLFEATAGMNVPGAWATSTGAGVTVAVIDTGYVAHSDVAGNIVAGYDFITSSSAARDGNGRDNNPADEGDWVATAGECGTDASGNPVPSKPEDSSWHGTHVAGTIAAVTNNAKGIAGIAYNAKVQPVRVLGKCGGATSDIADAITWASGGTVAGVPANPTPAKVINMSLGGSGACSVTYQNAINAAVTRGTTVVVAAGNSNVDVSGFNPANCNNVITVAASDRAGNRAFYSNFGAKIDITAPGGEVRLETDAPGSRTTPADGIYSTLNGGLTTPGAESYKTYMGTSMAAPHIAGLAALIAAKTTLTPAQIETAIKNSARALPGTCTGGCGSGLADATATLLAVVPAPGKYFENLTDVAIPDNTTVTSSITVSGVTGNAPTTLKVGVDIKHTYRGDLVISLVAPDGSVYLLEDFVNSDSTANVNKTYTVNASSEVANGTWKLRVQDVASQDTGTIDAWNLTF
ncbi:S8 family serine peptidase [Longispora sp. K20-0274]|uniref:S8 family peptidase n=1 Tax=Longispora sp. K20-0274 TaxID=3088255 RepID=UPI00399A7B3D